MESGERKQDTLKQRRTRHYVKIILGVYLIYTAYSMVRDLQAGVSADRPALFYGAAVLFFAVGAVLAVTSFRAAMKISAEELKRTETADAEDGISAGIRAEAGNGLSAKVQGNERSDIPAKIQTDAEAGAAVISADADTGADADDTFVLK